MPFHPPPAPEGTTFTTRRPEVPVPQPGPIPEGKLLLQEDLPGGAAWTFTLRRHRSLRMTALSAGANVSLLCLNRHDLCDRYNMADTLKGQHTARLTTGHILVSDMGRAMLSITSDTLGWHDPLGGHDNAAIVERKWGRRDYQDCRNEFHRNAHDNFLMELGKHGLDERDLVANVNFFSRLSTDSEGRLSYVAGHSKAGDLLDLRAEMDLLVILTTCHHPLDTAVRYGPAPVRLQVWDSPPPGPDDYCRIQRPENERAFYNSEILYL